ncbi:transglutaminase family protein [Desulfoluna sp.]|uniref:transglutaminase-like domain-containing protein n=1 Tax=Desulfoluna sp. TaxID=2045199 RepID=UPI00262875C3|nr:transglutaminase-like domain-containing protein [Desulfoluna sp.]
MTETEEFSMYLKSTFFIDFDSIEIAEYAQEACRGAYTAREKAISLFYAVRDDIKYDLFGYEINPLYMKASNILKKASGYCVSKGLVLCAAARSVGIPARMGFADLINHQNPGKIDELLQTNIFAFHGFAELYLEGKWVRATPSFDRGLCEKLGYFTPEFDGIHDSTYPEFNLKGEKHMEYVHYYGSFPDLPVYDLLDSVKKHYPHFFAVGAEVTVDSLIRDAGLNLPDVVPERHLLCIPPRAA